MLRDQIPKTSIGYGIRQDQLGQQEATEAPDPNAGIFARALHGNPIAKFFAASAATLVGAAVSTSLAKNVGKKALSSLAQKAARDASLGIEATYSQRSLKTFRDAQRVLDEYGGVTSRVRGGEVIDMGNGKKWDLGDPTQDIVVQRDGFFLTRAEIERANDLGIESTAKWSARDQAEQNLVKLARRLPYELPAAYVTQRLFTDPLLGTGPDEPVNWKNPIDVIGDFAQQSVKNLATAFIPFEAASGSVTSAFRNSVTDASSIGMSNVARSASQEFSVNMMAGLKAVGFEASDIIQQGVKVSRQSTGAMAHATTQAAMRQRSLGENLTLMRKQGAKRFWDRLKKGEESVGPVSHMADLRTGYRSKYAELERETDAIFGLGGSRLEKMASSLSRIGGKLKDGGDRAFADSDFFRSVSQRKYKDEVSRALVGRGIVDEDTANDFVNMVRFNVPKGGKSSTRFENRISIPGGGRIIEDADGDWLEAFRKTIAPKFGDRSSAITSSLEDVMKRADSSYLSKLPTMQRGLRQSWDDLYKTDIADQAKSMLGTTKMSYRSFDPTNLTSAKREFLVRETANKLGISGKAGARNKTFAEVSKELGRHGVDPADAYQLRSFLSEKGVISKPWNPTGRNLLGIKALSIQEGLDRGLFNDGSAIGLEGQKLAQALKSRGGPMALQQTRMGGVYQWGSKTFNVNPIQRSVRDSYNTFANELKVPLIQLQIPKMFGQGLTQNINDGPMVRMMGASATTRTLTGDADGVTNYLWFNTGRSKGQAVRVSVDDAGRATSRRTSETFRPTPDNPDTMAGRSLRRAMGNMGKAPEGGRSRFGKMFSVNPDQPNSLGGLVSRLRNKNNDPTNVSNFARRIMDDNLYASPVMNAKGIDALMNFQKNSSFSRNVLRNLGSGSSLKSVLRTSNKENIFDFDAKGIRDSMRAELDVDLSGMTANQARTIRGAQKSLLNRWANIDDHSALNSALPKPQRELGLAQRIDLAKMDYARYMAIKNSTLKSVGKYEEFVGGLIDEVNLLQKRGLVTGKEASEARIAVGSFYTSFLGIAKLDQKKLAGVNMDEIVTKLKRAVQGDTVEEHLAKVMVDVEERGRTGTLVGKVKKFINTGEYEFDGLEYNPSGVGEVLVPTFSTALKRDPVAALKSVAGINTYKNLEGYSGSSMGVSHLVDRMNKAVGMFGLSLDPNDFSGPLSVFGKGLIGKRALPIFAAGTAFMAADRTLGGVLNEPDQNGERVYSPYILGKGADALKEAQILASGLNPFGMTAEEKRYQLEEGEVAVKSGRYWPIGNTPFKGGKTQYYRPSWYRRFKSGYKYTDQALGTPLENLAFGQDFSPLKPLRPYHYEDKWGRDRPYPVSGDYFTGPWGPLTPVLNATVGRVLKPRREMYEDEVRASLMSYQPAGQLGAAPAPPMMGGLAQQQVATLNSASQSISSDSGSLGSFGSLASINQVYMDAANAGPATPLVAPSPFEIANPRVPAGLVANAPITNPGAIGFQGQELSYRAQEFAGIYGFAFGTAREALGFGDAEYENARPVLASADQAYGFSRSFWDLNLGGLGDFPTPLEGEYANFEASEIIRRFIPKPRDLNYVNPIANNLGMEAPWLPGSDYFLNFKQGDPFAAIPEGEMRLPGLGYERLNDLNPDETGRYGLVDRFKILADVAPYSNEYRAALAQVTGQPLSAYEQAEVDETIAQVEDVQTKNHFTPYGETGIVSWLRHQDTYFNTKLAPDRTATEDWERINVYGNPFPEWGTPIESFAEPVVQKARSRDPLRAAAVMGFVGRLFGATRRAKSVGTLVGGLLGGTLSAGTRLQETLTGEQYLPGDYKQQVAIEENVDILKYMKARRGFEMAQSAGDGALANQFLKQVKSTMYGADIYGSTQEELAAAIPKRKREHFEQMINAPEDERGRILASAGRLERRIYQAAWGMRVEKLPDLGEYFQNNELPSPDSDFWDPSTNMQQVEIKMLQHEGINPSQMGYFPQQVQEANLINPVYPEFGRSSGRGVRGQLLEVLNGRGFSGSSVRVLPGFGPNNSVEVYSGF